MGTQMSARWLDEKDFPAWRSLVASSPSGAVYALPEYLDSLALATDATSRILGVDRGGELVGGVGLLLRRSMGRRFVAPRTLLYYNGFVLAPSTSRYPSERSSHELRVVSTLADALESLGLARLELRSRSAVRDVRPLLEAGWRVEPSYSLEVPVGDLSTQWDSVEQNLRRLVRRAERGGLSMTDDADFEDFYRLHRLTHHRKGAPLYLPEDRFRAHVDRIRRADLCRLFQARLPNGVVVASQLVLTGPHPVSHTVAAGADPNHLGSGATPYLRWHAFQRLAELGFTGNDLTDATLNSTTHFKAQLGGRLRVSLVASKEAKWFHVSREVAARGRSIAARARDQWAR